MKLKVKKEKSKVQNSINFDVWAGLVSAHGITLIALVITIIILIILAGVTINLTLGENGIFSKARQAKENMQIGKYIENIELAREEVTVEKQGKYLIDDLIDNIISKNIVLQENIKKIGNQKAQLVTQEKYLFEITLQTTKYLGKGELDNNKPEDAEIIFSAMAVQKSEILTVTITLKDNETGVDINNSKYVITTSSENLGTDINNYTNSFETNPETITIDTSSVGEYYIHILTKDNSNNYRETISQPIAILEILSWTYNYTGANEEWKVPATGYYDIYCYGASGGSGTYYKYKSGTIVVSSGENGTVRSGCVYLKQNQILTLHVGGVGGSSSAGWNDAGSGMRNGSYTKIEGYGYGWEYAYDSGGGGGSTYVTYDSDKIISAKGGNGGAASGCTPGYGGGETLLKNVEGITWDISKLDITSTSDTSGNGSIVISIRK